MCEEKSIERFSMRERRKQSRGSMMVLYCDRGVSTKVIILRILGPLANLVVEKFRIPPHNMAFSQNSEANSSLKIEERCR